MNWLHYLLESNLYLIIFFGFYHLVLRRETWYQYNRIYLLVSSGLAFIIPFVQAGILKPQLSPVPAGRLNIQQIDFSEINAARPVPGNTWTTADIYLAIYLSVVLCLLLNLGIKIYKLIRLSQQHSGDTKGELTLIKTDDNNGAFSFFNYLFISPELALSETVVAHEMVHVRQKHSLDIVYFEIIRIVNWFNPVVYLLQFSIKELHEYIADNAVTGNTVTVGSYTEFLVKNAYGIPVNQLTNNLFNKSLLKKRIIMLHQKRSGGSARLKYLLILPLIAACIGTSTLAFAKSYEWIDVAPAKTSPRQSIQIEKKGESRIKRLKVTQGSISAITDKVSVREDRGKIATYTAENLTNDDKARILKNYNIKIEIVESDEKGGLPDIKFPITVNPGDRDKISVSSKGSTINGKIDSIVEQNNVKTKAEIKSQIAQNTNKLPPPSSCFSGGRTLYMYLGRHVRYPAKYFEQKIVGNVIVEFTTDVYHKISDVKIKNNAMPLFGDEVKRQMNAYTDTVNRPPGTYFFLVQFNLINEKRTRTWLPSSEYLALTGNKDCAGNVEIVGFVKGE